MPVHADLRLLERRVPNLETVVAYKSCWWLQDHIEFGLSDNIQACCYSFVDSKGQVRGSVVLCDVSENRFPAAEIRAARARMHAEIAEDRQDHCRDCAVLTLDEWQPRNYLAKFVTINVWSHCNLKCQYCYTAAPEFQYKKVKYSIETVIGDMLNGKHLDPFGRVTWGGGDISALPEFNAVSDLFIDYGVEQEYKTSGIKYLSSLASAISKKKGFVEISVDAGTRETYAKYKGKDVFDRVVENVLHYREHGPVRLKYIADFPNMSDQDINGFASLVERIRPEGVTITPEYNSSWAKKFGPSEIGRMARLIYAVKETGFPVTPDDCAMGERLFPGMWSDIDRELAHLIQCAPTARFTSGGRSHPGS